MKRSLILWRHAKAAQGDDLADDFHRPLTPEGVEVSRAMGRLLTTVGSVPDLAIASAAVRTRRTLELGVEGGAWTCPLEFEEVLYETGPKKVLKHLKSKNPNVERLLLTLHEPTCSELLSRLVGGGTFRFPPGAMARVDVVADWSDLDGCVGELRWLIPPKLVLPPDFSGRDRSETDSADESESHEQRTDSRPSASYSAGRGGQDAGDD